MATEKELLEINDIVKRTVSRLEHKKANDMLSYDQQPMLPLGVAILVLFDRINSLEKIVNAKREEEINSKRT